jgi:lipoprotein-releasing system permease protein
MLLGSGRQARRPGRAAHPDVFTVVGVFEAGHYEFDSTLAFATSTTPKAARIERPAGLRLRLRDMHQAPRVAAELRRSLRATSCCATGRR